MQLSFAYRFSVKLKRFYVASSLCNFVPIFISFKLKCRCHCIKQTSTSTCAKYIVLHFTDMMLVSKLASVLQGLPLPYSLTYDSFEKCSSFVSLNEYWAWKQVVQLTNVCLVSLLFPCPFWIYVFNICWFLF